MYNSNCIHLFRLDFTVIKICPAFFDVAVSNTFQSQWQNFDGFNLISRKKLPVSIALLFLAVVYCIMRSACYAMSINNTLINRNVGIYLHDIILNV
jgi:hypothetical protein